VIYTHYTEHIIDHSEAWYYVRQVSLWRQMHGIYAQTGTWNISDVQSLIKDANIMARSKQTNTKSRGKSNGNMQWVNVYLTEDDKVYANQWIQEQLPELFGYLLNGCERGFSFSIKPGKNDDWMATCFGYADVDGSPQNIGLSAYAASPDYALAGLLFKLVVCLEFGANIGEYIQSDDALFR